MAKSTEVEYQARIETVASLLSKFYSRREILQYASKKTDWNVTGRQVDSYIADAKVWLKEQVNEDEIKAKIVNEFGYLYKKNLSANDFRECRSLLESFAKLYGINAPEKSEVKLEVNPIFNLDE